MELVFLGTSAGCPTLKRNVQSVALKMEKGSVLLFDCGEGTQHQLLKKPVKPSRVSTVFLTHLHGDHSFGLPGLLCFLDAAGEGPPIEVIGPRGTAAFVRSTLSISRTDLARGYAVTELIGGPDDNSCEDEWCPAPPVSERGRKTVSVEGDEWLASEEISGGYSVRATHVDHGGIPCFAYRVDEVPRRSRLDAKFVESRLGENDEKKKVFEALVERGSAVLSDGSTLEESDVFVDGKKMTRGRSVVIFGDCRPRRREAALRLSANSDVVVHEATLDDDEAEKAHERGHSTPKDAGRFARDANVATLVLWHFSPRYQQQPSEEWETRFRDQARACGGGGSDGTSNSEVIPFEGEIILAHDFMRLPVKKTFT